MWGTVGGVGAAGRSQGTRFMVPVCFLSALHTPRTTRALQASLRTLTHSHSALRLPMYSYSAQLLPPLPPCSTMLRTSACATGSSTLWGSH